MKSERALEIGDIAIVAACNNEAILSANLRRSPLVAESGVALQAEWNAPSAAVAYNRGLKATNASLVVFAHQDVFLPRGWETVLAARIAEVEAIDPNWALIGSFGVGLCGAQFGPVWSSSIGCIIGRVPTEPVEVQSFDEHLFVMRRSAHLEFDEGLPGFHLYGTDIVQIARNAGRRSYAAPLPLIHNDGYKEQLGQDYIECYRYVQTKWRDALPLLTPVSKISWHGLHLARSRWQNFKYRKARRVEASPVNVDPRLYASLCGWSDLTLPDHSRQSQAAGARLSVVEDRR